MSFRPNSPQWWQWPTILSLDAPIVALLWQWQLGRVAGVVPGPSRAFVLGASVWLAYAVDRWIEGWRLAPGQIRTQRHHFYQHRRWQIAIVWIAILAADLATASLSLTRVEFTAGLVLLAPVLLYLLSHQLVHRHNRWRAPKEVCIALLLGVGVGLFPAAGLGFDLRPIAAPLALFMLLCFINCALISVWEKEVDQAQGQSSLARQFHRASAISRALPWLLAAAALLFSFTLTGAARTTAVCVLASSLLLAAVDRIQPRAGWPLARVLADVALMTPLVPLAVSCLR